MLVEIICGIVIYKLIRRFFSGDNDEFPGLRAGDSRLCFLVAERFEKVYGGKAYVGLRIPDADSGSRQSVDAVVISEREVIVIAIRNFSGYVEVGKDRTWTCMGDRHGHNEVHVDPLAEVLKQVEILKSYLEQRGITLPDEHFKARVVLPDPYCRVSPAIYSVPEVITQDKWSNLKPEGRAGFSSWIKDQFHSKGVSPDEIYRKLQFALSTAPVWDRLEVRDKIILGEFLEFKGKEEDLQLLRSLKRSKVSRIIVQKSTLFMPLGRSNVQLLWVPRDYRGEGTSVTELKEMSVKESTEVVFRSLHSRNMIRCKLSKIIALSLGP